MRFKLIIITLLTLMNFFSYSQTDTSYQNLLKRVTKTVPYNINIGIGVGYHAYLNTDQFTKLWNELVPERTDEGFSGSSLWGFEMQIQMPFFTNNFAAGLFMHQINQAIKSSYSRTSNGETLNYFGKDYFLPPGNYTDLNSELRLNAINLGLVGTYFPFRKGAWGVKFLTPFVEVGYGFTLLRGSFKSDPFDEVERFRRTNPLYFTLGAGTMFSSYNHWAGVSLKVRMVYSQLNDVLTSGGNVVNFRDGSGFSPDLNHLAFSLIVNYLFH